jgi:hypothetical protein
MASRLLSFRAIATALALTALVSSCSDDKNDVTPTTPAVGVSWTVDGANVTATNVQKTVTATEVTISAAAVAGSAVTSVTLNVPKTVGTYTIDANSDAGAIYSTSSDAFFSSAGTITVTSVSPNIIGTYTFTGSSIATTGSTKSISNGKFNVVL